MTIFTFLWLIAGAAWSQIPDLCAVPNASVINCPEHYLPEIKDAPPAAARDQVNAEIKIALQAHSEYEEAIDKLKKDKEREPGPMKDKDIREDELAIKVHRENMYAKFNAALEHTIKVYQLEPPQKTFAVDPKVPQQVRTANLAEWHPRFSELEKPAGKRWVRRENGDLDEERASNFAINEHGEKVEGGAMASATWQASNRISMYWLAFAKVERDEKGAVRRDAKGIVYAPDADGLAAFVGHETVHWVYNVAKRQTEDTAAGYFEEEWRAYSRQADILKKAGPDASVIAGEAAKVAETYKWQSSVASEHHMTKNYVIANFSGNAVNGGRWLGVKALSDRDRTRADVSLEPPDENAGDIDDLSTVKGGGADNFLSNAAKIPFFSKAAREIVDSQEAAAKREYLASPEFQALIASRQEELRRQKASDEYEVKKRAVEDRFAFAKKLGIKEFYRTEFAGSSYGFDNGPYRFFYWKGNPLDDEQAKAAFALASACMEALSAGEDGGNGIRHTSRAPDGLPEVFDTLRRRWSDPSFRYGLLLGTGDSWEKMSIEPDRKYVYVEGGKGNQSPYPSLSRPNFCVQNIVEKMGREFDPQKVYRLIFDFRKFVENEAAAHRAVELKWEREHGRDELCGNDDKACRERNRIRHQGGGKWGGSGGKGDGGGGGGDCRTYDLCGHWIHL